MLCVLPVSFSIPHTYFKNITLPTIGSIAVTEATYELHITIEQTFVAILPPSRLDEFSRTTSHEHQNDDGECYMEANAWVRVLILVAHPYGPHEVFRNLKRCNRLAVSSRGEFFVTCEINLNEMS
jgi:hypothetical protein